MTVYHRGFTLTPEQINRLLSLALDQLLNQAVPPTKKIGRPVGTGKRRGQRAPMTAAERRALSKRMKDMWKKRRAQGKDGRLDT